MSAKIESSIIKWAKNTNDATMSQQNSQKSRSGPFPWTLTRHDWDVRDSRTSPDEDDPRAAAAHFTTMMFRAIGMTRFCGCGRMLSASGVVTQEAT